MLVRQELKGLVFCLGEGQEGHDTQSLKLKGSHRNQDKGFNLCWFGKPGKKTKGWIFQRVQLVY
jgi:hypothetical protein